MGWEEGEVAAGTLWHCCRPRAQLPEGFQPVSGAVGHGQCVLCGAVQSCTAVLSLPVAPARVTLWSRADTG